MKLKLNLLIMILDNPPVSNKYTKSFLNLVNVYKLEQEETDFNFPENIVTKIKELIQKSENFINHIPLTVVERYYNEFKNDMNKYVFLEYNGYELTDMKIIDLYLKLEEFFDQIFELTCEIANYYNIEIKLKDNYNTSENKFA